MNGFQEIVMEWRTQITSILGLFPQLINIYTWTEIIVKKCGAHLTQVFQNNITFIHCALKYNKIHIFMALLPIQTL